MAKKDVSDAAQKVANAEKATAKASTKANKPGFFKRAGKAIPKFFKDFKGEIKKIVWPDLKTVVKSTGVVIACVLIVGIFIWIVDFGLTKGINSVRNLASSHSSSSTTEETTAATEEGTTVADLVIENETKAEETKAAGEETTAAEAETAKADETKAEATTAAAAETTAAEAATTAAE